MSDSRDTAIKTPYHKYHIEAGAKMVEFAGFSMPIQYTGITKEHMAVRENVGLFDLSHMGEFEVSGSGALAFLEQVTTNKVGNLEIGQIQYSCLPLPTGGIVDDLLVYKMPNRYMLVVNASNIEKDFTWLTSHLTGDAKLIDRSSETSLLAVQGPSAQKVVAQITDYDLESMKYYTWALAEVDGLDILFSRTGYTGEDGFEFYIHPDHADQIWRAVKKAGEKYGMELIGLAARDSLRLEMKMALYGNDIDETTSPIEASLGWIVDLSKDFIGKDIIARQKADKPTRRLVCLELEGRAFPRKGYQVFDGEIKIGEVTSGTFSPALQKPIAMAYVTLGNSKAGSVVEIEIRNKRFKALVVKPPFYKEASHR